MSDEAPSPRRFTLVCATPGGTYHHIAVTASSAAAAADIAAADGEVVAICFDSNIARAQKNRLLADLRFRPSICPQCDYSFAGLSQENDDITCPECGWRSVVEAPQKPRRRPSESSLVTGGLVLCALDIFIAGVRLSAPLLALLGVVLCILGWATNRGEHDYIAFGICITIATILAGLWICRLAGLF